MVYIVPRCDVAPRRKNEQQISTRCACVLLILRLRTTTKLSSAREGLRNIDLLTPATHQVLIQQGISVVRIAATGTSNIGNRIMTVAPLARSWRDTRSAVSNKVPSVSRSVILLMLRGLITLSGFARQRWLNIRLTIQWHNIFWPSDRPRLVAAWGRFFAWLV